ncbi:hypothetical protein WJX73_008848 [Symbiochloris irregularis]|uniref:Uncharacterized protein n=1 Tax=Symbiochloris irregularis TaxID=706552 RepID=A0AAW1NS45_9CHLO
MVMSKPANVPVQTERRAAVPPSAIPSSCPFRSGSARKETISQQDFVYLAYVGSFDNFPLSQVAAPAFASTIVP